MQFIAGLIMGSLLTIGSSFVFGFYNKSEKKDELLAKTLGKEFHEGISLDDQQVSVPKKGRVA